MKPAAFEYCAPGTLDEALNLLGSSDGMGKVIAGGQTLVPMMSLRMVRPSVLIDLNRVPGLDQIVEERESIYIGAMSRHRAVERSEVVSRHCPLLAQAIRLVAHPAIRNRGTAGGSLSHADPAAEWPTVAVATKAEILVRSRRGQRSIAAADFFVTVLTTALDADEIVVGIRLPKVPPATGAAFLEVSRRHGDFALVSVAAQITVSGGGKIDRVTLALGGVGPVAVDASEAAKRLLGASPAECRFEGVAADAVRKLEPTSDIHASAEYRREVAEALIVRALAAAAARIPGVAS